jgi:DNA uptake protein ComE-like DNA-binding protein
MKKIRIIAVSIAAAAFCVAGVSAADKPVPGMGQAVKDSAAAVKQETKKAVKEGAAEVKKETKKAASETASTAKKETVAAAKAALVDINTATKEQLTSLKGIGEAYSAKIIAGRPYKAKTDLVKNKILPDNVYESVKDLIVAKQK